MRHQVIEAIAMNDSMIFVLYACTSDVSTIDKMFLWQNVQSVAQDGRAAVRRGTQAHEMWRVVDRPIVGVMRAMMECDVKGHAFSNQQVSKSVISGQRA